METRPRIVLFDGVCGLCDRTVNFLLARDPRGALSFAPLQSEAGRALLRAYGLPFNLSTVVYIEHGRAYTRSSAVLRALAALPAPWPLVRLLLLVPAPVRDFVYDRVARVRYRLFGVSAVCRVPAPHERERFLTD